MVPTTLANNLLDPLIKENRKSVFAKNNETDSLINERTNLRFRKHVR